MAIASAALDPGFGTAGVGAAGQAVGEPGGFVFGAGLRLARSRSGWSADRSPVCR